ncbi:hypothetical protein LEN26_015591 [Aphanomyces euteiches]|nr:hypothetical protein LEN26_015591 [Aphanomyces euteiches]KAH9102387.1 hypothetical protein AeMF1_021017 [Aphanomyces euteiches]KAH9181883.1 hypothetical protein AeNC1_016142 [Aphanomyces euteiches]
MTSGPSLVFNIDDDEAMFQDVLAVLQPKMSPRHRVGPCKPLTKKKRFRITPFRKIQALRAEVNQLNDQLRRRQELATRQSKSLGGLLALNRNLHEATAQNQVYIQALQSDLCSQDISPPVSVRSSHHDTVLTCSFKWVEDTCFHVTSPGLSYHDIHHALDYDYARLPNLFDKLGVCGSNALQTNSRIVFDNLVELEYAQTTVLPFSMEDYSNMHWNAFIKLMPLNLDLLEIKLIQVLDADTIHVEYKYRFDWPTTQFVIKRFRPTASRTVFISRAIPFSNGRSSWEPFAEDISHVSWSVVDATSENTCVEYAFGQVEKERGGCAETWPPTPASLNRMICQLLTVKEEVATVLGNLIVSTMKVECL